jgi:hypothetical protein
VFIRDRDRHGRQWDADSARWIRNAGSQPDDQPNYRMARQPNATELQQWTTAIDQALAEGFGAVLGKVRDLGTMLFTSREYLNRNRTNSEFIIDLYWGNLHRTYDQAGYDGWLRSMDEPRATKSERVLR